MEHLDKFILHGTEMLRLRLWPELLFLSYLFLRGVVMLRTPDASVVVLTIQSSFVRLYFYTSLVPHVLDPNITKGFR